MSLYERLFEVRNTFRSYPRFLSKYFINQLLLNSLSQNVTWSCSFPNFFMYRTEKEYVTVQNFISDQKRCNMVPDCVDGSDEHDCICKDYFEVFEPDRICDGYPDCYDFSDELGCNR